ncbi:hypothetical protein ABPG74_020366 [Tetrahymena malaccensis]
MSISKIDLFSSQFYFNIRGPSNRKGTLFGSILSLIIVSITISYLAYLFEQYFSNQIDPNYRSQSFTNTQSTELDLTEDLISFRYESNYNYSVDNIQKEQNKTYIVYLAYFIYMNKDQSNIIPLNVIQCTNPDLEGFYCLDYSQITTSSLISDKIDKILSQVQIFVYGCLDLDAQKTTIPDNCASQSDIDNLMNAMYSALKIQIKTSQFNTKTQNFESSYRTSIIFTLSNQFVQSILNVQKQTTTVKRGLLIQSSTNYTSPLSFTSEIQTLDRQSLIQLANLSSYAQGTVQVDELYQEIYISYPTIPTILSLANSIFQVLMLLGFVARRLSMSSINKDLFVILLQNICQETYFKLLKSNNFVQEDSESQQQQINNNQQCQNQTDESQIKNIEEKNQDDQTQERQNNLNRSLFIKTFQDLNMLNSMNKNKKELTNQDFNQDKKLSEPPLLHKIFKKLQSEEQKVLSDEDSIIRSKNIFTNSPMKLKNEKLFFNNSTFFEHNQFQNSTILQQYQELSNNSVSIMILFDEEQLAALQQVGCTHSFLELDLKELEKNTKNLENISNHYEKQFAIFSSDELKNLYLQKFYESGSQTRKGTVLDKDPSPLSQIQNLQDQKESEIGEENEFENNKTSNLMPQNNFRFKLELDSKFNMKNCKQDIQEQSKQEDIQTNLNMLQTDDNFYAQDQAKHLQENIKQRSKFQNMQQIDFEKKQDITDTQFLDQPIKNSILLQNCSNIQKTLINNPDKSPNQQSKNKFITHFLSFQGQVEAQSNDDQVQKYLQNFRLIQSMKFSKIVNMFLFKRVNLRCCKRKKDEQAQNQNYFKTQKVKIEQQINKNLDILELYKDILQIKKAIMVLLKKDQFAALRLIGCSSDFLNFNFNQSENKKDEHRLGSFSQINIVLDEQYSQIQIQYVTIPFILSQVNSIFQLLVLLGFSARYVSRNSMKNNFILAQLQSTYLQKYLQILKNSKFLEQKEELKEQDVRTQRDMKNSEELKEQDILENNYLNEIQTSNFKPKYILDFKNSKIKKTQDLKNIDQKFDQIVFKSQQIICQNPKNQLYNYREHSEISSSPLNRADTTIKNRQNTREISQFDSLQIPIFNSQNQNKLQAEEIQDKQFDSIIYEKNNLQEQIVDNKKNYKLDQFNINIYFQLAKLVKSKQVSSQIHSFLFENRFCKKRSHSQEECLLQRQKEKISSQICSDLNIFSFYKDILFLKKAVMVLLNQEQLAMLQLVGCSNDYLNFSQSELENLLVNEQNRFSHFEKQHSILNSEQIHSVYIQKFLKRCQSQEILNKIDKRILSSLPKRSFSQINIVLDEQYSQIQIQYVTIPFILSQVNSIFQLLVLLGFSARYVSRNSMKNNFILAQLQSTYLQKYLQILQFNKFLEKNDQQIDQEMENQKDMKNSEELKDQDILENNYLNEIQTSNFKPKYILDFKNSKYCQKQQEFQNINSKIDQIIFKSQQMIQQDPKNKIANKGEQYDVSSSPINRDDTTIKNIQNTHEISQFDSLQIPIFNSQNKNKSQAEEIQNKQLDSIIYEKNNLQDQIAVTKKNKKLDQFNQNIYFQLAKLVKNRTVSTQIHSFLFENRFCKKRNNRQEECLAQLQKEKISSQICSDLNIFSFYKDILFLKKAVMVLLNQEQLAMLQLVGCSNDYLNFSQNELENFLVNEENRFSHFEKQQAILNSEQIHSSYIQKFLKRCQNKNILNKIDKRILTSLPKQKQIE